MPVNLTYDKFIGLNSSTTQIAAPQVSFLALDNFFVNKQRNALVKRGGSYISSAGGYSYWGNGFWALDYWGDGFWAESPANAANGDDWGFGGYAKSTASTRVPVITIPIRHRLDGVTHYIDKYNWDARAWEPLDLGEFTSFDTGDITGFAQIGSLFCICGDRPAKILDIDTPEVTRLGGPGPETAPSIAASVSSGALSGRYGYCYTFYDSTTGWESSPSPITDILEVSAKDIEISSLETSCDREGVDKKRLYRTQFTGEQPYFLVDEIDIADTTFSDDVIDDSLNDAINPPDIGDHDAPPENAYVVGAHDGRLWIASGSELWYSLPYIDNPVNLEYFSVTRRLALEQRITGLAVTRVYGLVVFCPPEFGVYQITGNADTGYSLGTLFPSEGTNYHPSICVKDDYLAYWGSSGPSLIDASGRVPNFSLETRNLIKDIVMGEYNSDVFCWTVWHEESRNFIFGYSVTNDSSTAFFDTITGISVRVVDSFTGALIEVVLP